MICKYTNKPEGKGKIFHYNYCIGSAFVGKGNMKRNTNIPLKEELDAFILKHGPQLTQHADLLGWGL